MTRRYLLDTNIISDAMRNTRGEVARRIAEVNDNVCTSIIVVAELRYGVARKASPRLQAQLEAVLEEIEVMPFESPADERYAEIRTSLEQMGQTIGSNDYLIAAQALATDCILVTDNEREFSRVPGLTVENWLR